MKNAEINILTAMWWSKLASVCTTTTRLHAVRPAHEGVPESWISRDAVSALKQGPLSPPCRARLCRHPAPGPSPLWAVSMDACSSLSRMETEEGTFLVANFQDVAGTRYRRGGMLFPGGWDKSIEMLLLKMRKWRGGVEGLQDNGRNVFNC